MNTKAVLGIFAGLGVLTGLWYLVNWTPQRLGIIFTAISAITLLVLLLEKPLSNYFGQPVDNGDTQVTPGQILLQVVLGVFLGGLVVFLSSSTGLSIGLPTVSASITGQAFTSTIVAPLIEEPFFRFAVPFLLFLIFAKVTGNRWAGAGISLILSSIVFAVYHWLAYGATLLVTGAFVGAATFGFLLLFIELVRNKGVFSSRSASVLIITFFLTHMIFNTFIYLKPLFIAGGTP